MTEEKKEQNKVVLVEDKLTKIIHQEGDGDIPKKGQQVHALYRGTLQNGEEFDSNQSRDNPFKFTLGQGQVIKGWDEGFASMRKGQKATLICSPQYAYGARGSPPRIPPNSTLNFEVQLLDFCDKKKQKWDLSEQEKIEQATKLKNEGNELLKNNDFKKAISKYNDGIQFVDSEDNEKAKALLKVLRMNASQAHLKAKQYSRAIQLCTKVLKEDPQNAKTLYRRGVAYLNNKDFDLAKTDLEVLLKSDPNNEDAKIELARAIQEKKAAAQKQKSFLKSMFSKGGLYQDKKPKEKKPKQKQETDSQNEQMPELEKDEEGEKKPETTETSEKSGHHHHGENCC